MKKILITLLLTTGFSCLSLNAQKPLKKPQKKPTVTTPAKPQPGKTPNKPAKPQKTHTQSSAPRVVATGTINGHGYVDLGLSVKWATCNVGASSPSDYGDYFAWGETKTKSEYTEANYTTNEKDISNIVGDSRYDAARNNWGRPWRMPTKKEIEELINKCETKWITYNGHKGIIVKGSNGNSIFIPAAGFYNGSPLSCVGELGCYWSSSISDESGTPFADYMGFTHNDLKIYLTFSHFGQNVRPVSE